MKYLLSIFLFFILLTSSSSSDEVPITLCQKNKTNLIPQDLFFSPPKFSKVKISPDGSRVSYFTFDSGIYYLTIRDVITGSEQIVTTADNGYITDYFWGADNHKIFYVALNKKCSGYSLFSLNLKNGKIKWLTPFKNIKLQIVDHDKNQLFFTMNKKSWNKFDLYKIDFSTEKITLLQKDQGNIIKWLITSNSKVGGYMQSNNDGNFTIYCYQSNNKLKKIISWNSDESMDSYPVGFSKDGIYLFLVDSSNNNMARLTRININDGTKKILSSKENSELLSVVINPQTLDPEFAVYNGPKLKFDILNSNFDKDFQFLISQKKGDFFINSRDYKNNRWIIKFNNDIKPPAYYVYDRNKKSIIFLFYSKPKLADYKMCKMNPFQYFSRDNVKINGYITFPNRKERGNLPTIIKVHGGPWWRDNWGFNEEVQFLANRGYLVVQPNYRGSVGFGKKFVNLANKEWGNKISNDIEDLVYWLLNNGYSDKSKIAIYGKSYGGFLVMSCLTRFPELFKCGIAISPILNIASYLLSIPPDWIQYRNTLFSRVGNPQNGKELKLLNKFSPSYFLDKIKTPLFLVYGINDYKTLKTEIDSVVTTLKKNNVPITYLEFKNESEGIQMRTNQKVFYKNLEKFLTDNLNPSIVKTRKQH